MEVGCFDFGSKTGRFDHCSFLLARKPGIFWQTSSIIKIAAVGLKFTNHPVEFSDVVLNLMYMYPLEMPHLFCRDKTLENLPQLTFSPPEKRGFSASDTPKGRAPYATSRDLIP